MGLHKIEPFEVPGGFFGVVGCGSTQPSLREVCLWFIDPDL